MSFIHLTIILLTIVEIVVAILLICLILAQKSKSGGGLGGIAGGGGAEEVFGSQGANVLMKATIYFSIFFFINTLGLAVLNKYDAQAEGTSVVEELGQDPGAANLQPADDQPAAGDDALGTEPTTPPPDAAVTPSDNTVEENAVDVESENPAETIELADPAEDAAEEEPAPAQ